MVAGLGGKVPRTSHLEEVHADIPCPAFPCIIKGGDEEVIITSTMRSNYGFKHKIEFKHSIQESRTKSVLHLLLYEFKGYLVSQI